MTKGLCCAECGSTKLRKVSDAVPVTVQLLGPPIVRGRAELTRRHSVAIVAYLASTQRMVSRAIFRAMLWPDAEQKDAEHNFRQALYLVARCVGPALLRRGDAVGLNMKLVTVKNEDASAPFLEGFRVEGASLDWDHWVERVRGPK